MTDVPAPPFPGPDQAGPPGWSASGGPAAPTDPWAPPAPNGHPSPSPAAPGWGAPVRPDPAPGWSGPANGAQPPAAQPWGAPPPPGAVPLDHIERVVTRSSRKGRVAAAGIGALALVGGGVFAATQFAGGSSGAATPEAAVERFMASINDEDVLGVLNALPRGERTTFVPVAQDTLSELKRLGVLSDDADLGKIAGLDIEVSGYQLAVDDLADTVANVRLSGGTVRGGYQLAELPLGSFVVDNVFDGRVPGDGASLSQDNDEPVTLTTVKDGEGWHVSLWYTAAEAARKDAGLPVPTFGHGVDAVGADSPEAAVEQLVGAIGDLDVRRMIELTPPNEMAALHDYAPLFLDDAEDAIAELRDDYEIDVDLAPTELTVSGDGARRTVSFAGFTADGSIDGSEFSARSDGECTTWDVDGTSGELCTADVLDEAGSELPDSVGTFLENLSAQGSGIEVVEVDGAWYVSPVGTTGNALVAVLRSLDADMLQDFVDNGDSLLDSAGSAALGGGFGSGFPFGSVDLNDFDEPVSGSSDDSSTTFDDDVDVTSTSLIGGDSLSRYQAECATFEELSYEAETAADWQFAVALGSVCALPYLQSGELDEFDVLSEFARPECYPAWPWDPALTLAQQDTLFAQIDSCLATPSTSF